MNKLSPENIQLIADLSERTVYLMGGSFVLGSLFTLLLLVILEFIRASKAQTQTNDEDEAQ